MKIEHYPEEKLKKDILKIIGKYLDLDLYKVFFFGSRVRGDNFERADIDLGIKGPKEISSSVKLKIDQEIEKLPMLYKIDIVDFKKVSDKFKKQALKNIEYVK
jgi:predicted nucleotidyltransferase